MVKVEPIIQALTSLFFLGIGVYFLASKRLRSTSDSESRIFEVSDWFFVAMTMLLVALGILLALFMIVLPQPVAWQAGKIVMFATAVFTGFFYGIHHLVRGRNISADTGTRKFATIIGFLFLFSAICAGILFIQSILRAVQGHG